jgi:hypothetical protein
MKNATSYLIPLVLLAFVGTIYAQDDFTKGSNYHLIYLDDESTAKIAASSITKDYRVDDVNHFLYIWSNTYTNLTPSGPNWNGEVGEFLSFQVNAVGWSGFGFASAAAAPKDMSAVTADYYLHVAMKSNSTVNQCIIMEGPSGLSARAGIGSSAFIDGSSSYPAYTNFTRDGQWHLIEIPMSYFFNQGLRYTEPFAGNVFALLSGGVSGTTIALDAIYIYKKGSTAVQNVNAKELDVLVTDQTLSIVGATQPMELYSITGVKVKSSKESVMGVEDVQKGIYIVRCGQWAKKVQIK